MIRLTVEAPGWPEVYEGAGAKEVGEQIISKHGPTPGPVPWEDQMDDGWVFPRFVITEELQAWAAQAAGVAPEQIRIEDI
ncbi:MAG: hypothetical protein LBC97_04695 [Bifidobacteriaceae bacterium]|jgi:hypothetical protein|nr:hypothetical protein [Bifidobacteriaceae bacterium]